MLVNMQAFEEARRAGQVTAYEVYPRQTSDVDEYQVKAENVPSPYSEDVRMLHGGELIDFWEEEKGIVWSKLPKLLAKTPQLLFALFGGIPGSAGNVTNTFLFGDDFLGTSLDTDKWSEVGSGGVSVSGGLCTITGGDTVHRGIIGKTTFGYNYHVRVRSRVTAYSEGHSWGGWADTGTAAVNSARVLYGVSGCAYHVYKAGSDSYRHSITLDTNFHIIEIKRVSATKLIFDYDDGGDIYTETNSAYIPTVAMYPHLTNWKAVTTELVWVAIGKYVSPEPLILKKAVLGKAAMIRALLTTAC